MRQIKGIAQNYEWGKSADSSLVSTVLTKNNIDIDMTKTYAEYWWGTHINGQSEIQINHASTSLLSHWNNNQLSYLFKVLSIDKPLSIQLHPDITTAIRLNKELPDIYKDANHKPEMFIVISDTFQLFLGFKTVENAYNTLLKYKDVFIFPEAVNFFNKTPNTSSLMNLYKLFIKKWVSLNEWESRDMVNHCLTIMSNTKTFENEALFKMWTTDFGTDPGILLSLFMNYWHKFKGDSLFICANYPHAYVKGDCYELMANSDNVIRCGLTPKFKDINNFILILEENFDKMIYDPNDITNLNKHVNKIQEGVVEYFNRDYKDFKWLKYTVEKEICIDVVNRNSIVFVAEGSVKIKWNGDFLEMNQYESYFCDVEMKEVRWEVMNINSKAILFIVINNHDC